MATTDAQLAKPGPHNGSGPKASAAVSARAMHLLILGLSAGVWAQGGYHGPGRLVLVVAIGAAGVFALGGVRPEGFTPTESQLPWTTPAEGAILGSLPHLRHESTWMSPLEVRSPVMAGSIRQSLDSPEETRWLSC